MELPAFQLHDVAFLGIPQHVTVEDVLHTLSGISVKVLVRSIQIEKNQRDYNIICKATLPPDGKLLPYVEISGNKVTITLSTQNMCLQTKQFSHQNGSFGIPQYLIGNVFILTRKHVLSNYFRCNIKVYGQNFKDCIRPFHWKKAVDLGYYEIASEILHTGTSVLAFARVMDPVRSKKWESENAELVMNVLLENKAEQCAIFKDILLKTDHYVLADATKNLFWSIGIDEKYIWHHSPPLHWAGRNILGNLLMNLRDKLRSSLGGNEDRSLHLQRLDNHKDEGMHSSKNVSATSVKGQLDATEQVQVSESQEYQCHQSPQSNKQEQDFLQGMTFSKRHYTRRSNKLDKKRLHGWATSQKEHYQASRPSGTAEMESQDTVRQTGSGKYKKSRSHPKQRQDTPHSLRRHEPTSSGENGSSLKCKTGNTKSETTNSDANNVTLDNSNKNKEVTLSGQGNSELPDILKQGAENNEALKIQHKDTDKSADIKSMQVHITADELDKNKNFNNRGSFKRPKRFDRKPLRLVSDSEGDNVHQQVSESDSRQEKSYSSERQNREESFKRSGRQYKKSGYEKRHSNRNVSEETVNKQKTREPLPSAENNYLPKESAQGEKYRDKRGRSYGKPDYSSTKVGTKGENKDRARKPFPEEEKRFPLKEDTKGEDKKESLNSKPEQLLNDDKGNIKGETQEEDRQSLSTDQKTTQPTEAVKTHTVQSVTLDIDNWPTKYAYSDAVRAGDGKQYETRVESQKFKDIHLAKNSDTNEYSGEKKNDSSQYQWQSSSQNKDNSKGKQSLERIMFRNVPQHVKNPSIKEFLQSQGVVISGIIKMQQSAKEKQKGMYSDFTERVCYGVLPVPVLPVTATVDGCEINIHHDSQRVCFVCGRPGHRQGNPDCPAYLSCDNEDVIAFQGQNDTLSNFYSCQLSIYGKQFKSSEHAYQWKKAQELGYDRLAKKIYFAKHAGEAKRLAKDITPEKSEEWERQRVDVMRQILRKKAKDCPEFRTTLELSGTKILAEATSDKFWATGLFKNDTFRTDPKFWPGRNTLGILLDALRSKILTGEVDKDSESDVKTEDEVYCLSPDLDEDTSEQEDWFEVTDGLKDTIYGKEDNEGAWGNMPENEPDMLSVKMLGTASELEGETEGRFPVSVNSEAWPESHDEDYHCPESLPTGDSQDMSDVASAEDGCLRVEVTKSG